MANGAWSWQSTGIDTGSYSVTVVATDRAGSDSTALAAATMSYTVPASSGCGSGLTGLLIAAVVERGSVAAGLTGRWEGAKLRP